MNQHTAEKDARCPNCGGLLNGLSHQIVCLTNAAAEIARLRAWRASALAICGQVEANPVGWGGDMAVSLARTIQDALTRVTPPAVTDGGTA